MFLERIRGLLKGEVEIEKEKEAKGRVSVSVYGIKYVGMVRGSYKDFMAWFTGYNEFTREFEDMIVSVFVNSREFFRRDDVKEVNIDLYFATPENWSSFSLEAPSFSLTYEGYVKVSTAKRTEGLVVYIRGGY
jgi:hypothetical protein